MAVLSDSALMQILIHLPSGSRRAILEPWSRRTRHEESGTTFGLSACGYDIRVEQELTFEKGDFKLASSLEHFWMPTYLVGIVHDKSTWARRGLAVQNTVIEPGWRGHLTLEVSNNSHRRVHVPAGSGIAQILFHRIEGHVIEPYSGKYQDQERGPQEARS